MEYDDSKVETGVWEAIDGILTVLVNGEEYISSPYTIKGDVVSYISTVPFDGFGYFPATLEFSKRN